MEYDLLNPHEHLHENYLHQVKETIDAYNPTQIVLGEALQNAIDAIVQIGDREVHEIRIDLNLDNSSVTVTDTGAGFPNNPKLLFLGGGTKRNRNEKIFGAVGVGIKVVLFSSERFRLRSKSENGSCFYEVIDANKYDNKPPPVLKAPERFIDDPSPIEIGTEIHYQFSDPIADNPIGKFIQEMYNECLSDGIDKKFGKILQSAVEKKEYESRFAGLMSLFLLRHTYAGDVMNRLGKKPELSNTTIYVKVICSDPFQIYDDDFGNEIGELFDNKTEVSFSFKPKYLLLSDIFNLAPKGYRIGSYEIPLGPGGASLPLVADGFNTLCFNTPEDYEQLVTGANGQHPTEVRKSINEYRKDLFPNINGIYLTIARIPHFDTFLPGGSRRVISANGVTTIHEVNLTRGRNQQYIRCFDLVIDVNAKLNYGKTQLTNKYLVNRINRFIDDAYATSIQTAASKWVGITHENNNQHDIFLKRKNLRTNQLTTLKEPNDENDVIALFFELASKGILDGYKSYGLSQKETYDGRFLIKPVGADEFPQEPTDDRQLSTVEFKTEVTRLFREFEQGIKNSSELKMIIAWKTGPAGSNRFYLEDIEHSKHYPNQVYPGVTHYLHDTMSGVEIQVLLLSEVVKNMQQDGEND